MKIKIGSLVFKFAFVTIFIGAFFLQRQRDLDLIAQEDSKRFLEEFEAREDAIEKKLRPLIERNKLINAGEMLLSDDVHHPPNIQPF